uniref:Sodium/hydrogen exchanger n=1 Tax=Anolis carolinensis TaxID=28377 RepID=A0A803T2K9_ANOCA
MGSRSLQCVNFLWLLLSLSTLEGCFAASYVKLPPRNASFSDKADPFDAAESGRDERLHVFIVDYEYVQIPYEVTLWILLASLAKIGFHLYHKLPHFMPESCLLIAMGVLVGAIIFGTNHKSPPVMTTSIYFLYLLPPIILEQGYFMPTRPFFENFGSIMWWSAMGSLINAFGIGFSLYGICRITVFDLQDVDLLDSLMFGSMISAVDPTAVLAVFEEMSVNESLYMMIFGESLLNDGITVVSTLQPINISVVKGVWIGVFFLFSISNIFRTYRFTFKDQLIIIYSGLRGASNFSLAFLLPAGLFLRKKMFITSTIVVIYFTFCISVGIQNYFNLKFTSILHCVCLQLMDHLKAGIEDICGHWSHYQLRDKFKKFDNRFLKKVLLHKQQPKSSLVSLYKKLEIKQVIEMVESGAMTPATSTQSSLYRHQRTRRLAPEEVESIQNILAHNLYQVRQRTLSYNRYNLAADASEKQAKEILIRRQQSLRQAVKKGRSLPWGGQVGTTYTSCEGCGGKQRACILFDVFSPFVKELAQASLYYYIMGNLKKQEYQK